MVREARAEDRDALAEVVIAAWRWAYVDVLPSDFIDRFCDRDLRREMMGRMMTSGRSFLVAADAADRPVGFASEGPPSSDRFEREVQALYVHPEAGRGGVGRALMRAQAQKFLARGSRSMAVQVLRDNAIGRRFYEKIGGAVDREDVWFGHPTLWYGWNAAAMAQI